MKELRVLGNDRGYIKLIFTTALIAFGIYAGIKFGMPYYRYSAFKSDVTEMTRVSLGNVNKTKEEVFQRAQELKIPIAEDDIAVEKKQNTVSVKTSWSETVDLLGVYQKTLDFDVDVEE